MLRAVGMLDGAHVPLLGVNMGVLGYLTEIEPPELHDVLDRFVAGPEAGTWYLDVRMMLADRGRRVASPGRWRALNEVVRREARGRPHDPAPRAHRRRAVHELRRRRPDRRHADRFDGLQPVGPRPGRVTAPPGAAAHAGVAAHAVRPDARARPVRGGRAGGGRLPPRRAGRRRPGRRHARAPATSCAAGRPPRRPPSSGSGRTTSTRSSSASSGSPTADPSCSISSPTAPTRTSAPGRATRGVGSTAARSWPRRCGPRRPRSTRTRSCTRCAPTSSAAATTPSRSATRSIASATGAASRPGASSPARRSGRSSTWRRRTSGARRSAVGPPDGDPGRAGRRTSSRSRRGRPTSSRRFVPEAATPPAGHRRRADGGVDAGHGAARRRRPAPPLLAGLPLRRPAVRRRHPAPIPTARRSRRPRSAFVASLDHSVWFHASPRVDDWHLYDVTCLAYAGGRGVTLGHVFGADGVHVATFAQEALVRGP